MISLNTYFQIADIVSNVASTLLTSLIILSFTYSAFAQKDGIIPFANDPYLSAGTKAFLKVLNSGGVPIESLSKEEARKVLIDTQASVNVDLSGIEESEKIISSNGYTIKLKLVRPEGTTNEILPVFIFIHGGDWMDQDGKVCIRFLPTKAKT